MKMTKESLLKVIGAADDVISALAGTNDEVHKDDTDKMVRLWDDLNDQYAPPEVVRELARLALAAMDSEPVALQPELAKVIYHFRDWNEGFPVERFKADYVISWMLANYPPAQPAPERNQVRSAHAEWSQATFGNVGPVGPLKHLSKEALEAAEQRGDLSEWADMQFLLWDAQRRAGITDDQITQAMIDKLAVNKQREWPEPKDGEPRLHIKSQPATQEVHDEK
ncbi:Eaa1 [Klebsiella pneumoniae]|nr:Eaa1 [Klebsiella pneumoniae]